MKLSTPRQKIAAFCGAAIVLGLIFVGPSTYARLIVNTLLSTVDQSQMEIQVAKPNFTWGGIQAESVWVRPKRSPFAFSASNVQVNLSFRSLLLARSVTRG